MYGTNGISVYLPEDHLSLGIIFFYVKNLKADVFDKRFLLIPKIFSFFQNQSYNTSVFSS